MGAPALTTDQQSTSAIEAVINPELLLSQIRLNSVDLDKQQWLDVIHCLH